jgi:membrane-bound lytic murein transglycosylase A
MSRLLLALFVLSVLASCDTLMPPSSPSPALPDRLVLQPSHFKEMTGWEEDNHVEALGAFLKSCGAFAAMKDTDAVGQADLLAPAVVWRSVCRKAQVVPQGDDTLAKKFFEEVFVPVHAANNGNPTGLITGYYEPSLKGSRTQHRPFVYPIYGLPVAGTPSYTRSQIDLGILAGHAPVLAYIDDPVQRFFLHIQGSGRITLENGSTLHVGYAGTNGRPYVSIGKALVDKGIMKKGSVTMPLLRQWLYDHPSDMWQVMWENTSYIFFRELKGDPVGTENVTLTAGRSLAVDAHYIPLGMPVFIDTVLPETPDSPMAIHRKLLIAQDTGHGIQGPLRGDIFFGGGNAAEQIAGRMKSGGSVTLLVPRALAITLLSPS